MQKFFMIIGKNKLNVYSTNGGQWEKQYFEGNPEFEYEVNNARHDIEKMFELLVSEYNLDSKAELEFSVLCDEDSVYNDVIERCIKEYICEKKELKQVLTELFQKLGKDEKIQIDNYGINFDGKHYMLKDGVITKGKFDLLGYTVSEDSIVKYIA